MNRNQAEASPSDTAALTAEARRSPPNILAAHPRAARIGFVYGWLSGFGIGWWFYSEFIA